MHDSMVVMMCWGVCDCKSDRILWRGWLWVLLLLGCDWNFTLLARQSSTQAHVQEGGSSVIATHFGHALGPNAVGNEKSMVFWNRVEEMRHRKRWWHRRWRWMLVDGVIWRRRWVEERSRRLCESEKDGGWVCEVLPTKGKEGTSVVVVERKRGSCTMVVVSAVI